MIVDTVNLTSKLLTIVFTLALSDYYWRDQSEFIGWEGQRILRGGSYFVSFTRKISKYWEGQVFILRRNSNNNLLLVNMWQKERDTLTIQLHVISIWEGQVWEWWEVRVSKLDYAGIEGQVSNFHYFQNSPVIPANEFWLVP